MGDLAKEGPDSMGLTGEERVLRSRDGEVCGMYNCAVPPEQLCKSCGFWYCTREYPFHMQKFPEHARKAV